MNREWLDTIVGYFVILILHIFIFGKIYLNVHISIEIYVLFILLLPANFSPLTILLLSAFMGLSVDLFSSGDIGLHTAAATAAGYFRTSILKRLMASNSETQLVVPVIKKSPASEYLIYTISIILVHNIVLFSLEAFDIAEIGSILIRTLLSTIITLLFASLIELIIRKYV